MIMDIQLASMLTAGALVVIGLYGAIFLDNILRKILALEFIEEGANLLIITLSYKSGGIVPIYLPGMTKSWFYTNSAYPLPQALVLTSIVIGASTLAVMLALVMVLYRKHHTLSTKELLGEDE